jgi:GR25 family glycosyltransferase involved in LPS biosynthesis
VADDVLVSWQPERTVVITLRRRRDRARNVERILAALGPDWPVEVVSAVDGAALTAPPAAWSSSAGAWACRESHLAALAGPRVSSLLVFEDDAVLPPDLGERLDGLVSVLPGDWEGLWLGGEHRHWPTPYAPSVVRCVRTFRLHAYLLRGDAVPVAALVCRRSAVHWDQELALALGRRGRTYAPDPFLVGVDGSPSDIPDSTPLPSA